MHTVVRIYSGEHADQQMDLVIHHREAAETIMRAVPGFIGYSIVRGTQGGFTITTCATKAASDLITRQAHDWASQHLGPSNVTPQIVEGEVAWDIRQRAPGLPIS